MNQHKVEFKNGPYDGLAVVDTPDFKEFYYVPIEGDMYHYYQKLDNAYVYSGEVSITRA